MKHHFPPILAALLFSLAVFPLRHWLVDDAGISLVYARNFVRGYGLVAQEGVAPVEGYSNPLWVLSLSPIAAFEPRHPHISVKLLSFGFVVVSLWCLHATFRLFPASRYRPWIEATALALIVLNPSFAIWTTSGLENGLYALGTAVFAYLLIDEAGSPHGCPRRAAFLSAAGTGLALTRPEGIGFWVFGWAALLTLGILRRPKFRTNFRVLGLYLLVGIVPLASYLALRLAYFGRWFPNTYYAKQANTWYRATHLLIDDTAINRASELLESMLGEMFPWILAGCGALLLASLRTENHRGRQLAFAAACLAAGVFSYLLLPPDWMPEFRFATPVILLVYPVLALLLEQNLVGLPRDSLLARSVPLGAILLSLLLIPSFLQRHRTFAAAPPVPFERIAKRFGERFNRYADRLGLGRQTFLVPDVGGTLYFSRHRVLDLAGLCHREIAELLHRDPESLRDHVFEHLKPTFIHTHGYWSHATGLFDDERLWEDYVPLRLVRGNRSGDFVRRNSVAEARVAALRRSLQHEPAKWHPETLTLGQPFPYAPPEP